MFWTKALAPIQKRFRRKRAARIAERFPETQGGLVVDIGGSLAFWKSVHDILKPEKVIIYNIHDGRMTMGLVEQHDNVEMHIYDGSAVPQPDGWADVVICNSVIEHVPLSQRAGLASEVARVGRRFVVQTPAPEFPLELHFIMPFVHWLPRRLARWIVVVSPFSILSDANAQEYFDETQLLTRQEFADHFPDAEIEIERFLGIPKSMLAFG